MKKFKRFHHHPDIDTIAKNAQEILSLNHQYGEGWLISGEVASFVKDGIPNVLCLQPFGCIANHIVAKGAEKKMRELYPQLNLLFLDADAGVSEVNFFNRMHFFLNHAKESSRVAHTEWEPDLVGEVEEWADSISLTKSIQFD
jgi:predicted nucleotide-binding protein (sugar kinase/HSP70/actin superfamily)